MSEREPCASWETTGTKSKLVLNKLRAEVEPNADKSGWLWGIRVTRGTGTIARAYTGVPTMRAAQLAAEAALLTLAAEITRIVDGRP